MINLSQLQKALQQHRERRRNLDLQPPFSLLIKTLLFYAAVIILKRNEDVTLKKHFPFKQSLVVVTLGN